MLNNTRKTFDIIIRDVRNLSVVLAIIAQIVSMGYFIYCCAFGVGLVPVNILAIISTAVYLGVYIIHIRDRKDKKVNRVRKIIRRINVYFKLVLKLLTLSFTVYGIYLSTELDGIAIILATLSIIMWVLQTLFEVIRLYVEIRFDQIMESIREDLEFITRPVNAVKNAVHDVKEAVPNIFRRTKDIVSGAKHRGFSLPLFKKKKKPALVIAEVEPTPKIEDKEYAMLSTSDTKSGEDNP